MSVNITFRFYEELKDFLPKDRKRQPFSVSLSESQPVKHAIESLGIPHTEVDLILVNSNPVDFTYKLKNNDYVSVYPVFETFDIAGITSLRKTGLRDPKFIIDVHLGKLAKYLRFLGFDTLYENNMEDSEIISISKNNNRIIITRDSGILKNAAVTHGYFVRSQKPKEQLAEVIRRFNLESLIDPFTRCSECNGNIKETAKDSNINELDPQTKKYYNKFYQCTKCRKIFWQGTHYQRLNDFFENLRFTCKMPKRI